MTDDENSVPSNKAVFGEFDKLLNTKTFNLNKGVNIINFDSKVGQIYCFESKEIYDKNISITLGNDINNFEDKYFIGYLTKTNNKLLICADINTKYIKFYSELEKFSIKISVLKNDMDILNEEVINIKKDINRPFIINIPNQYNNIYRIKFPLKAKEKYLVKNNNNTFCSINSYQEDGTELESFGTLNSKEQKIINITKDAFIFGGYQAAEENYNLELIKIFDTNILNYNQLIDYKDSNNNLLQNTLNYQNLIPLLSISKGSFTDKNQNNFYEINNRCRTNQIIALPYDCQLNCDTKNFELTIFKNKELFSSGFNSNIKNIPAKTPFKFIIREDPSSTFTLEELLENVTLYKSSLSIDEVFYNEKFISEGFEHGSLNKGKYSNYFFNRRARSKIIFEHNIDIIVSSTNYVFFVEYYNNDYSYKNETAWINFIRIPKGTKYKILISDNINEDDKSVEELVNDLNITLIEENLNKNKLPSYYDNYIDTKINTILSDIILKKDGYGDSFFFITDTHFNKPDNNAGMSGKLIKYLSNRTGINFCIHGGDVGGAYKDEGWIGDEGILKFIKQSKEIFFQYTEKLKFLNIHGNHDYNNYYLDNQNNYNLKGINISTVRNYLLSSITLPITYNTTDNYGMYYYYDNAISKIRYIIIDSEYNSVIGTMKLGNTQLEWIYNNAILTVPDGYDIIFVAHCPMDDFVGADTGEYVIFANLLTIIRAINNKRSGNVANIEYDFSAFAHKVIMVLTGHTHTDVETYIDNVLHVTTKCDKTDTSYPYASPFDAWVERKFGTVYEQAFEVITVFNNHSSIQFRRIGSGTDRLFHTEKILLNINDTYNLVDKVSIIPIKWITNDSIGNTTDEHTWTLSNTKLSISNGVVKALNIGDAFAFAEDANGNKEFFYFQII